MKRNPRSKTTKASALTSPRPVRVSLCKAGANQTPLNACKAESAIVEKKELPAMITSMKAQGYTMSGINFTGAEWTEKSVKDWLAEGGYEDYELVGEPGSFSVVAKGIETGDDAEFRSITTEGGVVVTLFRSPVVAEEAEPGDEGVGGIDPAEGAANAVQPVAKAVEDIVERAKAVVMSEERVKSLYQVSEMAGLIREVRWLVNDLSYDVLYADDDSAAKPAREAVIADLKSIGQQLLNAFAALVNLEVGEMSEAFKSAQEDTMTDITKTEAEVPAEKAADAPAAENVADTPAAEGTDPNSAAPEGEAAAKAGEDGAEGTADATAATAETAAKTEAVEQAPAWFTAVMEPVSASLKSMGERMDVIEAKAAEKSEAETVTAVPARKSADAEEAASGSAEKSEKSETMARFESNRLKSAMGL